MKTILTDEVFQKLPLRFNNLWKEDTFDNNN